MQYRGPEVGAHVVGKPSTIRDDSKIVTKLLDAETWCLLSQAARPRLGSFDGENI